MKPILTAAALSTLLALPASARPLHVGHDAAYWNEYSSGAMNNTAPNIRSNLNPRDPAYAGGDTAGDENDADWYSRSAR